MLWRRIKGRLIREWNAVKIRRFQRMLCVKDFTLISQNCIGGILYHDLGMQFLSPTVNLFIKEPDFVRFVLNLRYYMDREPEMRWGEEYPIGKLDDIEIHFMHYKTCEEAKESWNRRKARINWDRIIVLCTDRDGFDEAAYTQWKQIPYPKLLFTAKTEFTEDSLIIREFIKDGETGDLIRSRLFYRDDVLLNLLNRESGCEDKR